jgi:alcohol dehydrogenase YqhD (iron-dependent ADH family)
MIDFDFINPTRIIFGHQSEDKVAEILSSYGFKKILIVYGGGSIKKSGLYDKVIGLLDGKGIIHYELGGVTPNPDKSFVLKGRGIARDNQIDALLAIGGGSVIDVAKAIGVSFFYEGDPFDFNLHKAAPKKTLPVGVILTIASAGSESSNSCVISDYSSHFKQGFNSDLVRPLFAVEDPELTFSVSPYQTAAGIADIMMHSLERYFGASGSYQLSDDWALNLCKNVMDSGKAALKNPEDYEARAALMLDSSLSHDGLTSLGKKAPFVVHPLEHALSGYRSEVTHGAGVAVCYLGWARYVYKQEPVKFARLARILFSLGSSNEEDSAIMGIEAMKDFYVSIGMPTSLKEVGISASDLPVLANLATGNGTRVVGCCPQPLDKKAVEAVYALCLE